MASLRILKIILAPVLLLFLVNVVNAVPPTEEAAANWQADGTYDEKVAVWKAFKENGGCAPSKHSPFNRHKFAGNLAAGAVVDTARILVILVDFIDHQWNGITYGQTKQATPQDFDSILFSDSSVGPVVNPTGSMTDFYLENSYGKFYVTGGITNWLRMPETYVYYEGGTSGLTTALSRELATDAINAADAAGVNFQDYDYDDDGFIDGLAIIHAGHGAETDYFGIWSHKLSLSSAIMRDNVFIQDYTVNPEEFFNEIAPIGVITHEFGHTFGLPDLYDVNYTGGTSEGLGRWSLMASGTYNFNGKRPAHMDAWCKNEVGFLDLIEVTGNINDAPLPVAAFNPVAYKLWNTTSNPEYWIVENRQRVGFDFSLPGSGLLIYHVDPNAPTVNGSNANPNRYRVALEQADGRLDLEFTANNAGDGGDPFPGSTNNREFHDFTNPSDRVNYNSTVFPHIGVMEISNSDSLMFTDLDISFSRPLIELLTINFDDALGNNDGNLDGGETIRVYITARNRMRTGYNAKLGLATPNSNVNFTSNNVQFVSTFGSSTVDNNSNPVVFTLADSTPPTLDSFFVTIACDSTSGGVAGNNPRYSTTFGMERTVGTPDYLIVDDDRGEAHELKVTGVFSAGRVPASIWHVSNQGVPSMAELMKYPSVFWFTGDSAANVIDTARINRMRSYMDAGNNIFLSTMSGVRDIHVLDSAFLANYFKAVYTGQANPDDARGIDGSTVGDLTRYKAAHSIPFDDQRQQMNVVSGGEPFLSWVFSQADPYCGISYAGSYKSVLISFAFEAIQNPGGNFRPPDTLLARVLAFFGDFSTGIGDEPFGNLPESFELYQNYPNPFNPSTTISYTINSRGINRNPDRTQLVIYNLLGQKVRTLVDELQSAGSYSVEWGGENDSGSKMASGIYFYRLILGEQSRTRKMVLVK